VLFYKDLLDPVALLRGDAGTTELSGYWSYARSQGPADLTEAAVDDYSELMAETQSAIAVNIVRAYDFCGHRSLLDVGGGEGEFCSVVARACPRLHVTAADLPAVARRAESRFADTGLTDRAAAWGGDFLRDSLPEGADVVTLIRVVHDHDDAAVGQILRNIRRSLAPDGVLLIAEQLAETSGAESVGDTYFGLYLLAMGSGKPRTVLQLSDLLERAGFTAAREIAMPLPLQARLLIAHPVASQ
jgi:demethylspheroidene O-methyltransferase